LRESRRQIRIVREISAKVSKYMAKKRSKNRFNIPIVRRLAVIIVSLAVVFAVSVPLSKKMRQGSLIDEQIEKLRQEIDSVNARNESLKKMIGFLQSDDYAEEQARLQLGFKKEGEEVLAIKGLPGSAETGSPKENILEARTVERQEVKETNPRKWARYFFSGK
jgi:cell division protein FtsB